MKENGSHHAILWGLGLSVGNSGNPKYHGNANGQRIENSGLISMYVCIYIYI